MDINYTAITVGLDKDLLSGEVLKKMGEAHQLEYLSTYFAVIELDRRIRERLTEWEGYAEGVLLDAVAYIENRQTNESVELPEDEVVRAAVSLYSVIDSLQVDVRNKQEALSFHEGRIEELRNLQGDL